MELVASSGTNALELNVFFTIHMTDVIGIPEYSQELVYGLFEQVISKGDAKRGKKVYNMVAVSCASCHKISN